MDIRDHGGSFNNNKKIKELDSFMSDSYSGYSLKNAMYSLNTFSIPFHERNGSEVSCSFSTNSNFPRKVYKNFYDYNDILTRTVEILAIQENISRIYVIGKYIFIQPTSLLNLYIYLQNGTLYNVIKFTSTAVAPDVVNGSVFHLFQDVIYFRGGGNTCNSFNLKGVLLGTISDWGYNGIGITEFNSKECILTWSYNNTYKLYLIRIKDFTILKQEVFPYNSAFSNALGIKKTGGLV